MVDLETRARAARDAMRQSVAGVEVPPMPSTGSRPDRRWAAVATVTALIVATVALLATRDGGDEQAVISRPAEVPKLVAGSVPAGFDIFSAGDLEPSVDDQRNSITVYGASGQDDPFQQADLAVLVFGPPSSGTIPTSGKHVMIGEAEGVFSDARAARNLWWKPTPSVRVQLASRTLSDDQLVLIARGGQLTDAGFEPERLPDGLERVGRLADFWAGGNIAGWVDSRASGHWVSYQHGVEEAAPELLAGTFSGARDELNVNQWLAGPNTSLVNVRGHTGFLADSGQALSRGTQVLMWQEQDGVVAFARGLGVTKRQLLEFAEQLRPARDNEPAVPTTLLHGTSGPSAPTKPPAGWEDVRYHGLRMFVPPTWTVEENACPGSPRTVTLGKPATNVQCAAKSSTEPWIWLPPLETNVSYPLCGPGFVNTLPGCQSLSDDGTETWFIEGVDILIVDFAGRDVPPEYHQITSTWQYSDLTRTEAAGPDSYQLEQPVSVAERFAVAIAEGRCADAMTDAAADYTPACTDSPDGTRARATSARLTGAGGAVITTTAEVVIEPDSRTFALELEHRWSPEDRKGHWRVASWTERQIDASS